MTGWEVYWWMKLDMFHSEGFQVGIVMGIGFLGALAPTLVNVATSGNPVANIAIKMAAKKLNMPETSTLEQIEELVEREPDKIPALTQKTN